MALQSRVKEIIYTDSSRAIADMAVMAIGNRQDVFAEVWDICTQHPYPVNMRAARVLYLAAEKHPGLLEPYLDRITHQIITQHTDGVKRGLMKAVIDAADISKIPDSGLLVDYCFKLILDSDKPYAWRVYAMDIVFKTGLWIPELLSELKETLGLIEADSPCSVRSRAAILLKKINKLSG